MNIPAFELTAQLDTGYDIYSQLPSFFLRFGNAVQSIMISNPYRFQAHFFGPSYHQLGDENSVRIGRMYMQIRPGFINHWIITFMYSCIRLKIL